jgi:hypothetical protein
MDAVRTGQGAGGDRGPAGAREQAGREPSEIILQGLAAAADSGDAALETSREWRAPSSTRPTQTYSDDVPDTARIGALGENVSDRTFKLMGILSADPATHARKIKAMRATAGRIWMHARNTWIDPGESILIDPNLLPSESSGPPRLLQREGSEEVPVYAVAEGKAGGEPAVGVELVVHS